MWLFEWWEWMCEKGSPGGKRGGDDSVAKKNIFAWFIVINREMQPALKMLCSGGEGMKRKAEQRGQIKTFNRSLVADTLFHI